MVTRRVLFDASSSSPLKVSVAGVDAAGASWETLIFDANQPPIRLFLNTWMLVNFGGVGDFVKWANGASYPTPPAGQQPMFTTMWYQPQFSPVPTLTRGTSPYGTGPCFTNDVTNGQGAGGAVGAGNFMGISFVHETTNPGGGLWSWPSSTRIGYAIFRNTL